MRCSKRAIQASGQGVLRCPSCSTWHNDVTSAERGVPWDMPRPAPTRRQAATAAAPSTSSALPQSMAAAVGPDGWLRPPPQHQRMHPVDVLVDGVLAALDGYITVDPRVSEPGAAAPDWDTVSFTRLPLRDDFEEEGVSLDSVRRDLRRAVDRIMRGGAQEVDVRVS